MGYDKSQAERDIHDWNEWTCARNEWISNDWRNCMIMNWLIGAVIEPLIMNDEGGIEYIRVFNRSEKCTKMYQKII